MSAFDRRLTTASMTLLLLCAGCSTRSMELPIVNATANPLSIQDAAVAPAIDGMPYNTALSATGGTPGYQWAITTGNLPTGLALNPSSGLITGVASLTGTAKIRCIGERSQQPGSDDLRLHLLECRDAIRLAASSAAHGRGR